MSIELRPLGVKCNIKCVYCYQEPQRFAGNISKEYDLNAMHKAIVDAGSAFTIFGGEPLIIPLPDLEEILRWGFELYGKSSIQTNGTLIKRHHIDLFKKYNVSVGMSVDGPDELNDARRAGNTAQTRRLTQNTLDAIDLLLEAGITPGLIVTLHRLNAVGEGREKLKVWIKSLEAKGIRSLRLHVLEIDNYDTQSNLELTPEENIEAFFDLLDFETSDLKKLKFDLLKDAKATMQGKDVSVSCIWKSCDPYTTDAVQGIEGFGQRSNCGRTNKDGIDFVKAEQRGFERQLALYHTPQEYDGCAGCKFFLVCKGQCPGTSKNGDWRNRTRDCEFWKAILSRIEATILQEGGTPVSLHPRLSELEQHALSNWISGVRFNINDLLGKINGTAASVKLSKGRNHGDHSDHQDSEDPNFHHTDTDHGDGHSAL